MLASLSKTPVFTIPTSRRVWRNVNAMDDGNDETVGAPGGPASWFLLFGGTRQEAGGGLRSLRRVFDSEDEARAAFRRLRLEPGSAPGWAELVALDRSGRVKALCWFGVPSEAIAAYPAGSAKATEAPGTTTDVPGVSARRRLRRRLGKGSVGGRGAGVRADGSR